MAKKRKVQRKTPWQKSNPRKRKRKASKQLTLGQKGSAKRRAKEAGRPYPNLVDNMREAAKTKRGKKQTKRRKAKPHKRRPPT